MILKVGFLKSDFYLLFIDFGLYVIIVDLLFYKFYIFRELDILMFLFCFCYW